jgi:hypothetical protein
MCLILDRASDVLIRELFACFRKNGVASLSTQQTAPTPYYFEICHLNPRRQPFYRTLFHGQVHADHPVVVDKMFQHLRHAIAQGRPNEVPESIEVVDFPLDRHQSLDCSGPLLFNCWLQLKKKLLKTS